MNFIFSVAVLFFIVIFIVSILAFWSKYIQNQIKSTKEFSNTAEAGISIKRGFSKNLKTGKTRGQQRPTGISSVS